MAKRYTTQKRIKWKFFNGEWRYVFDGKVLGTAKTIEEKREIEKKYDMRIRVQLAIEEDEENSK
jgi:hypothetical protein